MGSSESVKHKRQIPSGQGGRTRRVQPSCSCSLESDHTDNRSDINSLQGGLLNDNCRYCELVDWRAPVQ